MAHEGSRIEQAWVVYALIVLGIVSRLAPHPWNATPVMAIALLGGTYLSKRSAILLPLTIVALSDLIIGWHSTAPFTWGAFVLTGLIAWWVRPRPSPFRVVMGALSGSVSFFLITNFGVWLVGGLYPRSVAGLQQCFVAALPFFRNTLMGDVVYTTVFFGGYALAANLLLSRHTARPA